MRFAPAGVHTHFIAPLSTTHCRTDYTEKSANRAETEWSEEKQGEWRQQIVDYYGDNVGEELFCIPRASSGAYLSSVLIEARMKDGIPILRWEMPAEFSGRPEAERYSETQAWCEDNLAPAIAALDPALASFFGEDSGARAT